MSKEAVTKDLCDERSERFERDLSELKWWSRVTAAGVVALAAAMLSGDIGTAAAVVKSVAPVLVSLLGGTP